VSNRQSNSLANQVKPLVAAFIFSVLLANNSQAQSSAVFAWGDDLYAQTNLPAGLTNVVALAAGANHTLALRSDGKVIGWGDDSAHQVSLAPGITKAIALGAGANFSLTVRGNGTVFVWSDNTFKQIIPPLRLTDVIAVARGD